MRERDIINRVDVKYPYSKLDIIGNIIEIQETPPMFEVQFKYYKFKKVPVFKILAFRIDKIQELYEIDIEGQKNIKEVMKRFDS